MAKLSIFKSTADGEQVNLEVDLTDKHIKAMEPRTEGDRIIPGRSLRQQFASFFDLADQRLFEVNMRIMITQAIAKQYSPEVQMALTHLMETLHGRNVSPEFANIQREVASEIIEKLIKQGMDQDTVVAAAKRAVPALNDGPANPVDINKN